MRILLDEQLPRQLARHIHGHQVRTVQQQGWAGLGNGELLRRAADDAFEVFVTADQNLQFQQHLSWPGATRWKTCSRSFCLQWRQSET